MAGAQDRPSFDPAVSDRPVPFAFIMAGHARVLGFHDGLRVCRWVDDNRTTAENVSLPVNLQLVWFDAKNPSACRCSTRLQTGYTCLCQKLLRLISFYPGMSSSMNGMNILD
ncbi:MAG: hypothetical protein ABR497_09720 [Kiritimatiellia bacterium]|nr:hypothetical protein [Lentisphaerota bacterium]